MKRFWNEPGATPLAVVALIRQKMINGIAPATATEWFAASEVAWTFDVHCGPPPTPIHDEIARRTAAGDAVGAGLFRARMQAEWSNESRAVLRWKGRCQSWLHGPSREEAAEAARLEREARAREEAIERRTADLLASEESASRGKRRADARARAAKEIT
jgi:hypothetical protein